MSNIVERLRDDGALLAFEAADTIERLRTERDKLLIQRDMIEAVAEPLRDRIQELLEEASCIRAERDNARADRDALREDAARYRSLMGKP